MLIAILLTLTSAEPPVEDYLCGYEPRRELICEEYDTCSKVLHGD